MQPQQPPGTVLAGRRADAGTVKLTDRDITGLMLCADHYGAPYDLLAAALCVRDDRLRGIVARWRHAGYAETGTLATGPPWCWLTASGMKATGLGLPGHPARAGTAGAYPRGARRPAVAESGQRGLPPTGGRGGAANAASAPPSADASAPRTSRTPKCTGPAWTALPMPGRCGRSRPN